MENALLTFVVPAYNVENYIEDCLNSLKNQTKRNHKVIIVDDGSKDRTGRICRKFTKEDPELFAYTRIVNHGLGYARNIGMGYVRTPYVTFLDSDDWLDLNYVEVLERELEHFEHEQLDVIYTLPVIYDSLTGLFAEWYDKGLFEEIFYSGNRIVSPKEDMRMYELEYNACRKIYRMDFVRKIGFRFDEGIKWEDVYPHFYCTYNADKCLGIREIGFHYRINTPNQITGSVGADRLDMVNAFAKTWHFLIEQKVHKDICNLILDRMIGFAKWSLQMSRRNVRKALIRKISCLVKIIPGTYRKAYRKSGYVRRNKLFMTGIRMPGLKRVYTDYLLKAGIVRLINKIRKVR